MMLQIFVFTKGTEDGVKDDANDAKRNKNWPFHKIAN